MQATVDYYTVNLQHRANVMEQKMTTFKRM